MDVLRTLVGFFVDVEDDEEVKGLLWATAYGFFILFSYYILRAVRDEISSADRGNLQILWTVVFFVMLVAVPLYSWAASKFHRGVFVPLANRFFIACLVAFWASLHFLPESSRIWIDRAFYVWTSVFALFVVTVFWGFVADLFRNEQAKRLFAFIAVGSSLGGIAGSSVTAWLATGIPRFSLLLIACVPLEIASWCALVLHKRFTDEDAATVKEVTKPLSGDALSGIKVIFRSPYLTGIALFILFMTFSSTILYFIQANLVGEAITDRGERTAFYAQIDLAVNVLTIVFQVYLTARIIKWVGVAIALALIPGAVALGFLALGAVPLLAVLVAAQVAYRAGRYGITKPAREILFTVVGREEKYKSKAFIDAAVYRGGDLVSGWIYAGLAALGLSIGAISFVAAPVAVVWTVLAYRLGQKEELMGKGEDAGDAAAAGAAAVTA